MNGTEMSRDWNSVVGLKVVLRTTHDHRHHNSRGRDANSARSNTVEGEIFCYDPQLQLLALCECDSIVFKLYRNIFIFFFVR